MATSTREKSCNYTARYPNQRRRRGYVKERYKSKNEHHFHRHAFSKICTKYLAFSKRLNVGV
jgi:hypothetical protein